MSHVLVLGADGYLGWPTAMRFSRLGYEVTAVDNYLRRRACEKLNVAMLRPIPTFVERAKLWHRCTNREIKVVVSDLSDPDAMRALFDGPAKYDWAVNEHHTAPDTVVHYAEQPSAPFSMLNHECADLTLVNNLRVTNNLMMAVRDLSPATHIIKLGTMGEYGTPNIDIEEGWIEIEHKGRKDNFLFPRQASSLYHTTKIMDTDLLWLGVRLWGLRVTDLMQGPVYGHTTPEMDGIEDLGTIFNYDEVFGTIINRFLVQVIAGRPLTVYGAGGQTRGYLNILDTLQCVELAAANPPRRGELRILNQFIETFSANDLAARICAVANEQGWSTTIDHVENPRKEAEDHYYNPANQCLLDLGVTPHYLTDETLREMLAYVDKYQHNIDGDIITMGIRW